MPIAENSAKKPPNLAIFGVFSAIILVMAILFTSNIFHIPLLLAADNYTLLRQCYLISIIPIFAQKREIWHIYSILCGYYFG